jgi:hypothetical protein
MSGRRLIYEAIGDYVSGYATLGFERITSDAYCVRAWLTSRCRRRDQWVDVHQHKGVPASDLERWAESLNDATLLKSNFIGHADFLS